MNQKSLDKPNTNNFGLINNQPTNTGLVDKKKPKELECNCIMSGYAQTTNFCPVHKNLSMKPKELDMDKIGGIGDVSIPNQVHPKELEWAIKFDKFRNFDGIEYGSDFHNRIKDFIKQTLTQQRTELLEEIKTRVDTWGGFEDDGGNLCHYDSEILEWVKNLLNKKDD